MRLAIYGTGKTAEYVWSVLQKRTINNQEVVYFVRSEKNADTFHGIKLISAEDIVYSDFDYLVVASDWYYEEILAHLESLNNGYEANHNKVMKYDALFPKDWDRARRSMPYLSCSVSSDIVYIFRNDDLYIPNCMCEMGESYSRETIDAFFELSGKYLKKDKLQPGRKGYFLDIGANIGTTSIYVSKAIDPELKIIGFEAGQTNSDLFKVNCILNHTANIKVEALGLSDTDEEKEFCYYTENSGSSHVFDSFIIENGGNELNIGRTKLVKLDDYLRANNICPEEITYIWIDTEGYESKIIAGAMRTLSAKRIPLCMELNPSAYQKQKTMEMYLANIQKVFSYFLDMYEYIAGREEVYSISEMRNFISEMRQKGKKQTDVFLF